jgi:hypothetical protein
MPQSHLNTSFLTFIFHSSSCNFRVILDSCVQRLADTIISFLFAVNAGVAWIIR